MACVKSQMCTRNTDVCSVLLSQERGKDNWPCVVDMRDEGRYGVIGIELQTSGSGTPLGHKRGEKVPG